MQIHSGLEWGIIDMGTIMRKSIAKSDITTAMEILCIEDLQDKDPRFLLGKLVEMQDNGADIAVLVPLHFQMKFKMNMA